MQNAYFLQTMTVFSERSKGYIAVTAGTVLAELGQLS